MAKASVAEKKRRSKVKILPWQKWDVVLHNRRMLNSYYSLVGSRLVDVNDSPEILAKLLYEAPFVVVSHGIEDDPIFKYGNQRALELFEMDWEEFTKLPSRKSAEPIDQIKRDRLLKEVNKNGFITNYKGVRITKSGRRFLIEQAVVWNVLDENGKYCGQAATFSNWKFLSK